MYGYIYLTENLINGKCYIGQHRSETFDKKYKGSGILINEAFKKYGVDNFITTIIEWCETKDQLNDREQYWIDHCNATNNKDLFYNIARGGEGHTCDPWNKGKHGVQEWTPAMEAAFEKGRHLPASEKLKEKLRNRSELVEYTPEYREKLSKASKEYNRTHKYFYLVDQKGKRHRIFEGDEQSLQEGLSNGWKRMEVKKNRHKLKSSTTKG